MDTNQVKNQMDQTVAHFEDELKKVRTGRANAAILDKVVVEAYGQPIPLNQVATVKVLDAQILQISPFDSSNLEAISTAISNDQTLDLNPADDGTVVRVPIPAMTEERRLSVVKQLHEKAEEAKISLRNHRQDTVKGLKSQMDAKELATTKPNNKPKQLLNLKLSPSSQRSTLKPSNQLKLNPLLKTLS